MTVLHHIVEPLALLLTWQPTDQNAPTRIRRTVGVLLREVGGPATFQYLPGTEDFEAAKDAGFRGFPAFDLRQSQVKEGAIEAFLRRVPSSKREDYPRYLQQHGLPHPFPASDFALLGYTGARLPSDAFALVPIFPETNVELDYITEVAGLRHVFHGDFSKLRVGDPVCLVLDSHNEFESDAVLVTREGERLGYVNRALRRMVLRWMENSTIDATISRVVESHSRPLVFLHLAVRSAISQRQGSYGSIVSNPERQCLLQTLWH